MGYSEDERSVSPPIELQTGVRLVQAKSGKWKCGDHEHDIVTVVFELDFLGKRETLPLLTLASRLSAIAEFIYRLAKYNPNISGNEPALRDREPAENGHRCEAVK